MKMKSILVSMLAVAALASCSKEDGAGVTPEPVLSGDNAYLSLAINAATPSTFAESGPTDQNGSAEESKASKVMVVCLQGTNIKNVVTFNDGAGELGTIGMNGTAAVAGDAFKVSKDVDGVFVIINPTSDIEDQVNAATTYAAMNAIIPSSTVDDITGVASITQDNKFLMTSAGALDATSKTDETKGIVSVTPTLAASESDTDIAAAKMAAKAAPAVVKVDRAMAKVKLAAFEGTVGNGATASLDGFKLNTTNTVFYLYADLVNYVVPTGNTAAKYRQDPNFSYTAASYAADFNWMHNPDAYTDWKTAGNEEYCFENTMSADAQNYNNTTKMLIKAKFAPKGVTLGDSWFRMNGIVYTLAQLQEIYNDTNTAATTKAYMDEFYTAMKAADPAMTATDFASLTIAELDAVSNGGYVASKIKTADKSYLIEYFQKSVCYYDVNLKHDNRVEAKLLGRWGVVRNNAYTLNITKISQPGKPYIPDPTDPEITDPENPDPDQPTLDDETSAYISVKITVNPWTAWTQETEL